jgi:hypothetical protein
MIHYEKITKTERRKKLCMEHAYVLETPDIEKIASNAWLRPGELFSETTGFMITRAQIFMTCHIFYLTSFSMPKLISPLF